MRLERKSKSIENFKAHESEHNLEKQIAQFTRYKLSNLSETDVSRPYKYEPSYQEKLLGGAFDDVRKRLGMKLSDSPYDASLSGKSLAGAIGYRQEKGFYPEKAVVAPYESDTRYVNQGGFEDFTMGHVKYVSSHGGGTEICFICDENGPTHARFITLQDPNGKEHVFDKGETGSDIADFTDRWIQVHGKGRDYNASPLLEEMVNCLRPGYSFNGWTCTKLTYTPMEIKHYKTDQGMPIKAIVNVPYKAYPKEAQESLYANSDTWYENIEDPTPTYNCHANTFLPEKVWLYTDQQGSEILKILDHNDYKVVDLGEEVDLSKMQHNDVAVYGNGKHSAPTFRPAFGEEGIVDSKLGPLGRLYHKVDANEIVEYYKDPTVYRTDREGGNILLPWDPYTDS